jgi:hypothetical protein
MPEAGQIRRCIPELTGETEARLTHDSSTNALIRHYWRLTQN